MQLRCHDEGPTQRVSGARVDALMRVCVYCRTSYACVAACVSVTRACVCAEQARSNYASIWYHIHTRFLQTGGRHTLLMKYTR